MHVFLNFGNFLKSSVFINFGNFLKSYGHLSEIFAFYHNMVKSRDSWC